MQKQVPVNRLDIYTKCKRAIAFIYKKSAVPETEVPTREEKPIGTGFLLSLPLSGDLMTYFVITNKHVTADETELYLRLNDHEDLSGKFEGIQLHTEGIDQNIYGHSDNKVDLVAIELNVEHSFLPAAFDESCILDHVSFPIAVGSAAFAVGYLSGYPGLEKNYPVVRFGRIALISEEEWFSSQRNLACPEQAYLAEFSAVGGASGSPVILDVPERPDHPLVVGVIKAAMESEHGKAQGLVAIEPPTNLKSFIHELRKFIAARK